MTFEFMQKQPQEAEGPETNRKLELVTKLNATFSALTAPFCVVVISD